jgi:hypothetical protein
MSTEWSFVSTSLVSQKSLTSLKCEMAYWRCIYSWETILWKIGVLYYKDTVYVLKCVFCIRDNYISTARIPGSRNERIDLGGYFLLIVHFKRFASHSYNLELGWSGNLSLQGDAVTKVTMIEHNKWWWEIKFCSAKYSEIVCLFATVDSVT